MADVKYPLAKYRYKVTVSDKEAGFSEVTGYDASIEATEYREGNMPAPTPIKVAGIRKYSNITLKWGVTSSKDLYDWMAKSFEKAIERKTVAISLMDDESKEVATWQIINAWPVKYTGPEFNATSSDVAIESLELAHEGMTRTK